MQPVLLQYPKWTELRKEIYGERFDTDIKKLIGDPTLIKMTTAFVITSGLLPQFRNCTTKLPSKLQNTESLPLRQALEGSPEALGPEPSSSESGL